MDQQNRNQKSSSGRKRGPSKKPSQKKKKNLPDRFVWLLIIAGLFIIFQWVFSSFEETSQEMTYKTFYEMAETNRDTGTILSAVKVDNRVIGKLIDGKRFIVNIPDQSQDLVKVLRENVPEFDIKPPQTFLSNLFYSLGPMLIFIQIGRASGRERVEISGVAVSLKKK